MNMKKDELRETIKSQIQDSMSSKLSTDSSESLDSLFNLEAERKKIFLEERDSFYKNQKGFIKIVNEIGEEEWVREIDLKKREGYFNFEDDLEDADSHKRKVIRQIVVYCFILAIAASCGIYYFMESPGYLEVNCNIKGLPIFIDDNPTGLSTDNVIENVKIGKHKVSLRAIGYKIEPAVIEVDLKHREGLVLSFSADSLKSEKADTLSIPLPVTLPVVK